MSRSTGYLLLVVSFALSALCFGTLNASPRKVKKKSVAPVAAEQVDEAFFINKEWQPHPSRGLNGRNIALWGSHGLYFDRNEYCWQWQRPCLFTTVEDLFTSSFTENFLIPMLENAGAFVMTPREHDTNTWEEIIDSDGVYASREGYRERNGKYRWETASPGFAHDKEILEADDNPFRTGSYRIVRTVDHKTDETVAEYWADIPEQGEYAVYISYASVPGGVKNVPYTVHAMDRDRKVTVNQNMGGATWIYLGKFPFQSGEHKIASVSNLVPGANGYITADAVKIGGGTGNVGRRPTSENVPDYAPWITSGKPRYTEGARYWMQWAGVPDSVYSPTLFEDDYTDDYRSRGLWVNYLSGGSKKNPDEPGLGIPVDLAFALHSDAGITGSDSIIGTLAIYSTDRGTPLGDGSSRKTVGDYASTVQQQVVNDILLTMEPTWTMRKIKNSGYAEARSPKVPAMILELLSHQNRADMLYGLDPSFKFVVARAIYKGILRYLSKRSGTIPVIQPLPVNTFSITPAGNTTRFVLRWRDTVDELEATAVPTSYIIEKRVGEGTFVEVARTEDKTWQFNDAKRDSLYSFRIIAVNDGGRSFPSEVLACGYTSNTDYRINVVNGFTRVGPPETVLLDNVSYSGRLKDNGVPWGSEISFTGEVFDSDPSSEFTHNYSPGYGGSRSGYAGKTIQGNSFDYVSLHGASILKAGYSFFSQSLEAFTEPMEDYYEQQCIDLILGKQKETSIGRGVYGSRFKTFPMSLQEKLERCVFQGTDIFVSGSYVASDLWLNAFSNDSVKRCDLKFARDILGIEWKLSDASSTGEVYTVPLSFPVFRPAVYEFSKRLNAESYAVDKSDSFGTADSDGKIVMRYSENNLPAATAMRRGNYDTMIMGFPFESISSEEARDRLMEEILEFLTLPTTGS